MITHKARAVDSAPVVLKGYANIAAGQVHYRHLDGPGLPVMCFHQTASSGAMWLGVMERFWGERGMLAWDTPGFGGSFDPETIPQSMEVYADWLLAAIDTLGIANFDILSHHTGVCIAAEMAVKHPGRIRSIAMIGAVPLSSEERREFSKHYSEPIAPDAEGKYLAETWRYLAGLGADRSLALHHRELLDTVRAYSGRYMAYTNVWCQDFTALLKQISCPLMFLCSREDVLWPYFERAKSIRPDAQWAILDGANFEPDLDPDGVAQHYRSFLATI